MNYTPILVSAVIVLGLIQVPAMLLVVYSWRCFHQVWKSWEDSRRALTLALLAVKNQDAAARMHASVLALSEEKEQSQVEQEEYDDELLA